MEHPHPTKDSYLWNCSLRNIYAKSFTGCQLTNKSLSLLISDIVFCSSIVNVPQNSMKFLTSLSNLRSYGGKQNFEYINLLTSTSTKLCSGLPLQFGTWPSSRIQLNFYFMNVRKKTNRHMIALSSFQMMMMKMIALNNVRFIKCIIY